MLRRAKLALFAFFALAFGWENAKCANERWQKKVGQKKNKFLPWLFCGMFVKA